MKTIQCAHCLHDVTIHFYYALCFMLVEHSVCLEPIFVLINVYIYILYIYIYIYVYIYIYIIVFPK